MSGEKDWIDHDATARSEDGERRGVIRGSYGWVGLTPVKLRAMLPRRPARVPAHNPSPEGPMGTADYDYDRLQRDLGLPDQTSRVIAIGVLSLVVVILIGIWLIGSAHHGSPAPVHLTHIPIPGPPGPQGSLHP